MRLIVRGDATDEPPSEARSPSGLLSGGWKVAGVVSEGGEAVLWGIANVSVPDVRRAAVGWEELHCVEREGRFLVSFPLPPSDLPPARREIPGPAKVEKVAAGEGHVLCLAEDGSVWSCGDNRCGCVGTGSEGPAESLRCVLGPSSEADSPAGREPVCDAACGAVHSAAVGSGGAVFCWGCNLHGECGRPSKEDVPRPSVVEGMGGLRARSIGAGLHHTMAITAAGDAYGWGSNADGQLCLPELVSYPLPALVESPEMEDVHLTKVCCGARHSAALSEDGRAFGWGWNAFCQVSPDASRTVVYGPIELNSDCVDISAGHWHTLLLASS